MLHFDTWGGGGWGDPLQRDASLVARDVARGLVSVEGARRYGVVLNQDLTVDAAATDALRTQMGAARPAELPVFDRGGTIEALKASAVAETGLNPPATPTFGRGMAQHG